MKLPLSQADQQEIEQAYVNSLQAAEQLAEAIGDLRAKLEMKMACIGKERKIKLQKALEKSASSMFRIETQNYKVKNSGFDGREFS